MARRRPHATALRDGGTSLTYGELDAASDRTAAALRARGVAHGTLVGVAVDRTWQTPVHLLGVLKAGCAYVPLDPLYPTARLRQVSEDCGLTLVLGAPETARACGLEALTVPEVVDARRPKPVDLAEAPHAAPPPEHIAPGDPAYVIHTSGSTGRPKGCLVSHGNVLALTRGALPLFDCGPDDRWSLFHSACFDFSVWELWGALLTGGTAVCVPAETARAPEDFLDLLERERVTVLSQVPSAFRALARMTSAEPRRLALRYVVFGGERLDLDVAAEFAQATAPRPPVMVNMYGITEATVHSTAKFLSEADLAGRGGAPLGTPLPHVEISLRDADLEPVPDGEVGEIWIAGAGVALGYLNRPELTAERFRTLDTEAGPRRFYRTGDLARRTESGELEYLGRNDQQVKVRGFRIEPGEIEAALRDHPDVRDAAVGVGETRGGAALFACVVHRGTEPDRPVLRRHLSDRLPAHMVPRRFAFVDALPLTASGKLDRQALHALAERGGDPRP
ncbi:amino acid adenylation domain-containing protein [Streptomyces sp. NPDC051243]|uniref:amino acid adenylation domain-containing protein n=1 Tax=Streptomyces sp. NPDC051243 TaxID=3365646 RepID=UPI0037960529